MSVSWEQQSDEPELWYDRFTVYRLLGPTRTLPKAYALVSRLQGKHGAQSSAHWHKYVKRWQWEQRAADFDAEQVRLRQVDEFNRRQATVDHLLALVVQAVLTADLPALSQVEARKLLPTLRLFYRDLFVAQGQELTRDQGGELPTLGAEEMRLLLEQVDRYRAVSEAEDTAAPASLADAELPAPGAWRLLRDELATLYPDEASARRVAAQAKMECARIVFGGRPVNTWHAILTEAELAGQIDAVAAVAQQEYPANPALRQAIRHFHKEITASSPTARDAAAREDDPTRALGLRGNRRLADHLPGYSQHPGRSCG